MSDLSRASVGNVSIGAAGSHGRRRTVRSNRSTVLAPLLVGLLLGTSSSDAKAELVNILWDGGGRFEQRLAVAPGKFVEVCGPLERGLAIAWTFKSDRPLNFNIHYHEGKEVVYPAKRDAVQESAGKLAATLDQNYCWMWSNKTDAEAHLVVTMAR